MVTVVAVAIVAATLMVSAEEALQKTHLIFAFLVSCRVGTCSGFRGFAEQARAMHYGEQDKGSIHGEVAPAEAKALAEEGINVAQLPFPVIPPEAKN